MKLSFAFILVFFIVFHWILFQFPDFYHPVPIIIYWVIALFSVGGLQKLEE